MDFAPLGIPNFRTTKVGSRRSWIEMVEAVVRLEAWDGYSVKRWENDRAITDWKIVLDFAGSSVSAPEDWDTQVAAYHRLRAGQPDIATVALQNSRADRRRKSISEPSRSERV